MNYFDQLCSIVGAGPKEHYQNHRRLLLYLFHKPYSWTNSLDENRAMDAIDMANQYGENREPCVLDVLVAVCLRMENDIMGTGDTNQLAAWFVDMLISLNLYFMDDTNFDSEVADIYVDDWLAGDYRPDGRGGLFTIPNFEGDMRLFDIWYQMQFYLNYKY